MKSWLMTITMPCFEDIGWHRFKWKPMLKFSNVNSKVPLISLYYRIIMLVWFQIFYLICIKGILNSVLISRKCARIKAKLVLLSADLATLSKGQGQRKWHIMLEVNSVYLPAMTELGWPAWTQKFLSKVFAILKDFVTQDRQKDECNWSHWSICYSHRSNIAFKSCSKLCCQMNNCWDC